MHKEILEKAFNIDYADKKNGIVDDFLTMSTRLGKMTLILCSWSLRGFMRVWDQYIVNIACPLLTGTISEIDQLSWGSSRGSRGHGEAKV